MNTRVFNLNNNMPQLISKLEETTELVLAQDPSDGTTFNIIRKLGDKISVFFARTQGLVKNESSQEKIKFIAEYFFTNFSRISENNKAAGHIIAYVTKRPQWLKEHADRIIEFMKTLYSDLLALKLDCEELYYRRYNKNLEFDFGLDFQQEQKEQDSIIDRKTALKIIGVTEDIQREDLKKAFRDLAKKYHPDLNPGADPKDFLIIKQAFTKILEGIVP